MLPLPAGREASPGGGAFRYARHRPERTLLYQLVEEYYPAFLAFTWVAPTGTGSAGSRRRAAPNLRNWPIGSLTA